MDVSLCLSLGRLILEVEAALVEVSEGVCRRHLSLLTVTVPSSSNGKVEKQTKFSIFFFFLSFLFCRKPSLMHSILDVDFPYKYSKIEKRKERERVRGCRFHIIIESFSPLEERTRHDRVLLNSLLLTD